MSYQGDYAEDATLDFKFPTRNTSGAPTTLGGTPALSVYKANGTTQSTAGITLTVDFDSVTGCNHVRIDLSADAFYATGNDYQVVITTGTVDGTSVVGETVATFSIENRLDRVGANGASLSAVPWNSSWDAEVQSEVDDALVAQGLDHLVNASATGTDVTDDSLWAQLVSASATADFDDYDNTTDSLKAIRDRGDTSANDRDWETSASSTSD